MWNHFKKIGFIKVFDCSFFYIPHYFQTKPENVKLLLSAKRVGCLNFTTVPLRTCTNGPV